MNDEADHLRQIVQERDREIAHLRTEIATLRRVIAQAAKDLGERIGQLMDNAVEDD